MNEPSQDRSGGDRSPAADSLNAVNVIVDGPGDTTIRPRTPEKIAAMKRFWERQGRKPPPPYDKL